MQASYLTPTSKMILVFLILTTAGSNLAHGVTFLKVGEDLGDVNSLPLKDETSVTGCGLECFKMGTDNCIGFEWRPNVQSNSGIPGFSFGAVARVNFGRCYLHRCMPQVSVLPSAQLFLLANGPRSNKPTTIKAPDSYTHGCIFAYRVYDKVLYNYTQAEEQCLSDGATLITIKSASVQAAINEAVITNEPHWIGRSDRITEGDWIAADGSHPSYTNWDAGQPNNFVKQGKTEDQDCAMLWKGTWGDARCSRQLNFICYIPFLEF